MAMTFMQVASDTAVAPSPFGGAELSVTLSSLQHDDFTFATNRWRKPPATGWNTSMLGFGFTGTIAFDVAAFNFLSAGAAYMASFRPGVGEPWALTKSSISDEHSVSFAADAASGLYLVASTAETTKQVSEPSLSLSLSGPATVYGPLTQSVMYPGDGFTTVDTWFKTATTWGYTIGTSAGATITGTGTGDAPGGLAMRSWYYKITLGVEEAPYWGILAG